MNKKSRQRNKERNNFARYKNKMDKLYRNNSDVMNCPNLYFGLANMEEFNDRADKHLEQRLTRGFDDTELWNLYNTIANYISPRLKEFKKQNMAYPPNVTEQEWDDILDKMIFAFDFYANCDEFERKAYREVYGDIQDFTLINKLLNKDDVDSEEITRWKEKVDRYQSIYIEYSEKANEGLKLFAEYFSYLTW